MRAGDVFMQSLVDHGVDCLFGNPGTTENAVLDRLVDFPQLQYYTTLHEGVAVGAATFYALASGKTGVVNLHVAPGLGNAIGLMFGALKANAPMVVTAGQQDTRMRMRRTLFSHDLTAMAAPVTKWSTEPRHGEEVGAIMQQAFRVANEAPQGPVFVSLPVDVMEHEVSAPIPAPAPPPLQPPVDYAQIEQLCDLLAGARNPLFIIGDDVARASAVETVVSVVERCGAVVMRECIHAQTAFPTHHPHYRGRASFDARSIRELLAPYDVIVLVGGQFFEEMWYEAGSAVPEGATVVRIEAAPDRLAASFAIHLGLIGDIARTLSRLDEVLDDRLSPERRTIIAARRRTLDNEAAVLHRDVKAQVSGLADDVPMPALRAVAELARALPNNVTIIDESLTTSLLNITSGEGAIVNGALYSAQEMLFDFKDRHDFYAGRGGGLGQGMAGAIGLQVALPKRRVVALIGDGSGMYSIQALWTAAHCKLPILFVIFSNREYRVLKHNLDIYRYRFGIDPTRPYLHMDLSEPALSYPQLAVGMGVPAATATTPDELAAAVDRALTTQGPFLIDVEIAGKA